MGAAENLDSLKSRAPEVAELLRLLSHPVRLRVALTLMGGEMAVSGIAEIPGVAQPALSRDIARYRAMGLVSTRRAAKEIYYRLSDERLRDLLVAIGAALPASSATPTRSRTCRIGERSSGGSVRQDQASARNSRHIRRRS